MRAKRKAEKILLTPKSVELISNYVQTNYTSDYSTKYLKYYYYILYNVWVHSQKFHNLTYVPIAKGMWRSWLSVRIKTKALVDIIKDDLVTLGILECDNYYYSTTRQNGDKKFKVLGYKLSESFFMVQKYTTYSISKINEYEYSISNKISVLDFTAPKTIYKELELNDTYRYHITSLKELKIDYINALNFINTNINKLSIKPKPRTTTPRILTEDVALNWTLHCFMVQNKYFYLNKGNDVDRLFTNLTNFPGKLKDFLYFNKGIPCKAVDVVNSQPLLINALMYQDGVTDVNYLSDCEQGLFYEKMNTAMGLELNEHNRNVIKVQVYTYILFGKTNEATKLMKAFKLLYPIAYKYIVEQKQYGDVIEVIDGDDTEYKDDSRGNNKFAIRLQNIEAAIVMKAAETVHKKKLLCLTIHDALFVEEHNKSFAEKQLIKEFNKYNINPKIK